MAADGIHQHKCQRFGSTSWSSQEAGFLGGGANGALFPQCDAIYEGHGRIVFKSHGAFAMYKQNHFSVYPGMPMLALSMMRLACYVGHRRSHWHDKIALLDRILSACWSCQIRSVRH